ncbi:MAG: hypothetical protein CBC82_01625 [Cellvibrionales bacterium TMED122]|nr:DUF885 domain-containing protein [Halieaceae bacterium]OUV67127.1 MAG: hypothetical protein CBC82_01625 [Cellvibrionales bacterium TMED122]
MNGLKRSAMGLLGTLLVVAAGASMWFWFTPVGVNNYVNKVTLQLAIDSPELLTYLGAIDNTPLDFHSGKLADYTKEEEERSIAKLRNARVGLDDYGPDGLSGQELLTWKIAAWFFDDQLRQAELRYSGYRVNQISGVTVNMPQFLTDTHVIKNKKSVRRYLSRLAEFGRVLRETHERVTDDRANGVIPPDFVIEKALVGMNKFIEGGAAENPLVTTLGPKLEALDGLDETNADQLVDEAAQLVATEVIPGYQAMISLFESMLPEATHDAGIWRLPDGDAIYAAKLQSNTTTQYSPDEIHATGLAEVDRIEGEMLDILDGQGIVGGSFAERVRIVMEDPAHQFPNTDEGRADMIAYLEDFDRRVMAIAADYFITIPPQPLEIVRVPEYSQDSSPGGYYNGPALDGSRPGRFYINQKQTADNPRWTLPTLMIHEGSPGHHFQISTSQLIEGVPLLRRLSPFSAFSEGWALYSERIAKTDMGLYDNDPLGDLGRLQAEMFRAVRLVVDTGMHAKRWSREQAIEYMITKTGMTTEEVTREIERYVVWPGQATAYKTGQLALLTMREEAELKLGERFDLREFHEAVLMNGAMPLDILNDNLSSWAASQ